MLKIEALVPDSVAALAGLLPGDDLVSINGRTLADIVDYHLAIDAERLQIEVLRQGHERICFELQNEAHKDPGLHLQHPEPARCGNNCLFCFVHQLPPGMRKTLYVKDEDYRFSYLYGSYVTLSNVVQADLQRIIDDQLSPLYVSVHTTDDMLRAQLLGRHSPPILQLLQRLTEAGIEIHCQIVVCPGINDGSVLQRSIDSLYQLAPGIRSLAIVPVGLTRFRNDLPALRTLTRSEAVAIVEQVTDCQRSFLAHGGSRFVFAADELYLLADYEVPELSIYEDLWQLENGVGMVAQFRQDAADVLDDADLLELERVTVLTGYSFALELKRFAKRLSDVTGVVIEVFPVRNRFFGEQVTVTGLLTGRDLLEQLSGRDLGVAVFLPDVMLKDGENLFLDDLNLNDVEETLQVPVIRVESTPWGLLEGLENFAGGSTQVVRCEDL